MNKILALLTFFIISPAFAVLHFEIKQLPADYFLCRPFTVTMNPSTKMDAPAIKKYVENVKLVMDEMKAEAKNFKLTPGQKHVLINNWVTKATSMCLPVTGEVSAVPQGKLKVRTAGKYLVGTLAGPLSQASKLLDAGYDYIVSKKEKFAEDYYYHYFTPSSQYNGTNFFMTRLK